MFLLNIKWIEDCFDCRAVSSVNLKDANVPSGEVSLVLLARSTTHTA